MLSRAEEKQDLILAGTTGSMTYTYDESMDNAHRPLLRRPHFTTDIKNGQPHTIQEKIHIKVNLMKNKQHEYILKAFLKSKTPTAIRQRAPELIVLDSFLGGYCTQLLANAKSIELPSAEIISRTEKAAFSELINHSTDAEKDELTVYYQLAILVESVLIQYRQ